MNSWRSEFADTFRGAHVLVTGATGFIGWRLSQVLVGLGADVTGLSRSANPANLPEGVRPNALDLTERESVAVYLGNARFDTVIHLAGHVTGQPRRELVMPTLHANLLGTVHLLEAINQAGCDRLVYAGSSDEPTEGADAVPRSPYAAAKYAAGAYVRMFHGIYGTPAVVVRLFLTYGPRQELSKLVPYAIRRLRDGAGPSLTNPDSTCDAIYVDDVVRCMLKAAVAPPSVEGATFDVGSGHNLSVHELVGHVAQLMGQPTPSVSNIVERADAGAGRRARIEDTEAALGWVPMWPLHDGLRETIRWYSDALVASEMAK